MFFIIFFTSLMGCYLYYWHNVFIKQYNKKLFRYISKKKNILDIKHIRVNFYKNSDGINWAYFRILFYENEIVLLKKNRYGKYTTTYLLTTLNSKGYITDKYFINYAKVKNTTITFKTLYLTFQTQSKTIIENHTRQENIDTVFEIELNEYYKKVMIIIEKMKIA